MKKKWTVSGKYVSMLSFFFIYYTSLGLSSFLPKYYAEIGMKDGQIGTISSVPSLIAMAFIPIFGTISDHVPRKRYILTVQMIMIAAACFLFQLCEKYIAMFAVVTLYVIFSTATPTIATTIGLEYCEKTQRRYGPVRMTGTLGYQAGLLLVALLLSDSLSNLYTLMGIAVVISCFVTLFMPNVEGHQKKGEKVSPLVLFKDKRLCWLYGMILFGDISAQFYGTFFTKYMGDIGMSNRTASLITFLSVLPEVPFLWFGDRIKGKTSVWNWVIIGMLLNGLRWVGLAVFRTAVPIILVQMLAVTTISCFEFIPAFYIGKVVRPELKGTAQSILHFTTFGACKVLGSLVSGFVCEKVGIATMFAFYGIMLLSGCLLFWRPTRRLIREDEQREKGLSVG